MRRAMEIRSSAYYPLVETGEEGPGGESNPISRHVIQREKMYLSAAAADSM